MLTFEDVVADKRVYTFKSESGRLVSIYSDNPSDARLEASYYFTYRVEGKKMVENFEQV